MTNQRWLRIALDPKLERSYSVLRGERKREDEEDGRNEERMSEDRVIDEKV